ncbi:hypothetical protein BDFB_005516, partial [Asbolus verrucosus]
FQSLRKDEETGEITTRFNCETGEEESVITSAPIRGKPKVFKIPSSYYMNSAKRNEEKVRCEYPPTAATAVLYLLPTTILFYPILGIITVTIEVIIHIWAHRKNKLLKNKNLYYQSPLHIICKEFCGACKEENSKMKITMLHERRADKIKKYGLEYVRRIVT